MPNLLKTIWAEGKKFISMCFLSFEENIYLQKINVHAEYLFNPPTIESL